MPISENLPVDFTIEKEIITDGLGTQRTLRTTKNTTLCPSWFVVSFVSQKIFHAKPQRRKEKAFQKFRRLLATRYLLFTTRYSNILYHHSRRSSPSITNSRRAIFPFSLFQHIDQCNNNPCSAGSQWVTDCNSPAMNIYF